MDKRGRESKRGGGGGVGVGVIIYYCNLLPHMLVFVLLCSVKLHCFLYLDIGSV